MGGGGAGIPPISAKLAQTPIGARINAHAIQLAILSVHSQLQARTILNFLPFAHRLSIATHKLSIHGQWCSQTFTMGACPPEDRLFSRHPISIFSSDFGHFILEM